MFKKEVTGTLYANEITIKNASTRPELNFENSRITCGITDKDSLRVKFTVNDFTKCTTYFTAFEKQYIIFNFIGFLLRCF